MEQRSNSTGHTPHVYNNGVVKLVTAQEREEASIPLMLHVWRSPSFLESIVEEYNLVEDNKISPVIEGEDLPNLIVARKAKQILRETTDVEAADDDRKIKEAAESQWFPSGMKQEQRAQWLSLEIC